MKVSRWSLDKFLLLYGAMAVVALYVPLGIYVTHVVTTSAEQSVSASGKSLARTVASQIVEAMLLEDRLAVHDAVHRAASGEKDVRYVCVENAQGQVVAHTFPEGYPLALPKLWQGRQDATLRFRTDKEEILDVSAPILQGQLGRLHVGLSCRRATEAADRTQWWLGAALAGALAFIGIGVHVAATNVTRPLRQLEAYVSRLPQEPDVGDELQVRGTKEVAALCKGFSEMADRLRSLEKERTATQGRMVNVERLAALGELGAGLAHEIHNPLDGMLECVRYLDTDPDKSGRAAKYYPMLQDGLDRIAGTMKNMLTFVRLGERVSVAPCQLSDAMEALSLLVEADLKARGIRLTWDGSAACMCLCDRQGLSQAALNLILNAADAAEGGEAPEIRVVTAYDSEWVNISVEDTGPGVPEDLREKVFLPFFSTKPDESGTGLGLSVSRQLIYAAGGDLSLSPNRSRLGGARFVIRLPRDTSSERCDEPEPNQDTHC